MATHTTITTPPLSLPTVVAAALDHLLTRPHQGPARDSESDRKVHADRRCAGTTPATCVNLRMTAQHNPTKPHVACAPPPPPPQVVVFICKLVAVPRDVLPSDAELPHDVADDDEDVFVAFSRVFSGVLRPNSVRFLCPPPCPVRLCLCRVIKSHENLWRAESVRAGCKVRPSPQARSAASHPCRWNCKAIVALPHDGS